MPVRNCEKTVAVAMRSVLNQSFQDWEMLVIDDGSSDGTLVEVRRFQDSRVRVLHDGYSKGLPARLNEAIKEASSEFLARMDGDDVCYPERLQLQLKYLRSHPGVHLVGGGVLVFGVNGLPLGKREGPESHDRICIRPHAGFPIVHPTFCGKADWFRRFRYRGFAVRCEDQDMLLRGFRTSRYANVPGIVLGYREGHLDLGKSFLDVHNGYQ
jgi:glycosyltransferase involved in cell wall biosynthesis